jgi:threonine/homoserine/homoserine lactone efflux protein
VLHAVLIFVPVAALLALSPGPATAVVIQSAARGGRRPAVLTMSGNAVGLALWAVASMLGVSALVVASAAAFAVLKIVSGVLLVALGVQAIRRARGPHEQEAPAARRERSPFRAGLLTALANPKVALFYVALLPQFVPSGSSVLVTTLLLAGVQIALSCAWYFLLASVVGYARAFFVRSRRTLETVSGGAMILFGLKIASE